MTGAARALTIARWARRPEAPRQPLHRSAPTLACLRPPPRSGPRQTARDNVPEWVRPTRPSGRQTLRRRDCAWPRRSLRPRMLLPATWRGRIWRASHTRSRRDLGARHVRWHVGVGVAGDDDQPRGAREERDGRCGGVGVGCDIGRLVHVPLDRVTLVREPGGGGRQSGGMSDLVLRWWGLRRTAAPPRNVCGSEIADRRYGHHQLRRHPSPR